ncbi:MAG TPA: hypothetical protein VNK04_06970 [Gemmataceae bacterium]|nr:hypothetical protein [Gemmataceae bacterium]
MSTPADPIPLRRLIYALLIIVALADVLGRILSVANVYEPHLHRSDPGRSAAAILLPLAAVRAPEAAVLLAAGQTVWEDIGPDEPARLWPSTRPEPMPTLGGNDRSRWATIRALVDHGTYAIGHRRLLSPGDPTQYVDEGITTEDGWRTLDKVLHPERQEFYSSKPPLLPTLLAGEYWLLKHMFGWSLTDREGRWLVVRTILVTVNLLPMLVYLVLLARLAERFGTTDWGRLYVVAAGAFATFLTPFAIVINNHTVAACSALFALYPVLAALAPSPLTPLLPRGERGEAAPVSSAPGSSFPLSPASGERGRGEGGHPAPRLFLLAGLFAGFTATCELPAASFLAALFVLLLVRWPGRTLAFFVPAAALPVAGLLLTNYLALGELLPAYSKLQTAYYQYEGSYWRVDPGQVKRGIDWAWQKESKAAYAFHLLLGHHGLFSLTPIWLLAAAGIVLTMFRRSDAPQGLWVSLIMGRTDLGRSAGLVVVSALALFLSVVVIGFYLFVAARMSNNYGGWTSGPRWFIWLTPFWLLTMLPAADRLAGCRWGRALGYLLLAVSVVSVSYPAWNPWRHPWIYNFFEAQGWVRY